MKEILLTQGKVALVDDEDYERLSKIKWSYSQRDNSPVAPGGISMSHIILQTSNWIDHKDRNRLDNQRSNLRICTPAQNNQNRKKIKKKTDSRYKGVSLCRCIKRWRATIGFQDVSGQSTVKHLGCFETEEEAAKAYDKAARYYHEDFAALNFAKEGEQSCH